MAGRGRRVADVYAQMHINGDGLPREVRSELDDIEPIAEASGEKAGVRWGKGFKGGAHKAGIHKDVRWAKRLEKVAGTLGGDAGHYYAVKFQDSLNRMSFKGALNGIRQFAGDMGAAFDLGRQEVNKSLGDADADITHFHDRIGRLFGKGSRNDFLNFIGGLTSGIASIPAVMGRAISAFAGFAGRLKAVYDAAGGGARGLAAAGSSLAGSFAALAPVIAGAVVVAGLLVTVLSSLLAIVVALSATIATALVGALGVLAGAVIPLVALVGGLVVAFKSLSEGQVDRLKSAFKGLSDTFTTALKPGIEAALRSLEQFARTPALKVLAGSVGAAVSDVIANFGRMLNAPPLQNFIRTMGEYLPDQIRLLGEIMRNTFEGLAGMFSALAPFVTDFLEWMEELTQRFSDWANSAKGKNEIADFMDRAGESAKSLGKFLGAVGDLLGKLLFGPEGASAGNKIFEDMAKGIEKFAKSLDPDDLKEWFNQGKEMAKTIGDIIKALGKLIAVLDDPTFQAVADGLFEGLVTGFETIAGVVKGVIAPLKAGIGFVKEFVTTLGDLFSGDINFGEALANIGTALVDGLIAGLGGALGGLWSAIKAIPEGIINIFKTILGIASPSTVFFAIAGDIIAGLINGLVGAGAAVVTALGTLATTIINFFVDAGTWLVETGPKIIAGLVSGLISAPLNFISFVKDKVVNAFSEAGGWIKEKGTVIINGLKAGITTAARTVGAAFSGVKGFVSNAFSAAKGWLTDRGKQIIDGLKSGITKVKDTVKDAFSGLKGKVTDALSGAGNWLLSAGRSIVGGLISGIKERAGEVSGVIGGMLEGARRLLPFSPAKEGPFSGKGWTLYSGRSIAEALAQGLEDEESRVVRQARRLVDLMSAELDGNNFTSQATLTGRAAAEPLLDADPRNFQADPAGGTGGGSSKSIDASGWVIQTNSENPETVAKEVLNEITGRLL